MAVSAPTQVAAGSAQTVNTVATGSWAPVTGRLYVAWIAAFRSAGCSGSPTLTGNNMTWTAAFDGTAPCVSGRRLAAYWMLADGTSTTGATTAAFAGVTQDDAYIRVVEYDGVASSSTVRQYVETTATSTSIMGTLAAFGASGNATAVGVAVGNGTTNLTAGTGFTKQGSDTVLGAVRFSNAFRADNDTTADYSWTTTSNASLIAFEVVASSGAINVGALVMALTLPTPSVFIEGSQTARPVADITAANWRAVPNTESETLFDKLDEAVVDDADYAVSPVPPADTQPCEIRLTPLSTPSSTTPGGTLRIRLRLE